MSIPTPTTRLLALLLLLLGMHMVAADFSLDENAGWPMYQADTSNTGRSHAFPDAHVPDLATGADHTSTQVAGCIFLGAAAVSQKGDIIVGCQAASTPKLYGLTSRLEDAWNFSLNAPMLTAPMLVNGSNVLTTTSGTGGINSRALLFNSVSAGGVRDELSFSAQMGLTRPTLCAGRYLYGGGVSAWSGVRSVRFLGSSLAAGSVGSDIILGGLAANNAGEVFYATEEGKTAMRACTTGSVSWSITYPGEHFRTTPVLRHYKGEATLLLASNSTLRMVHQVNGSEIWAVPFSANEDDVVLSPVGGFAYSDAWDVFVVNNRTHHVGINAASGSLRWAVANPNEKTTCNIIIDARQGQEQRAYVGTNTLLRSINVNNGTLMESYDTGRLVRGLATALDGSLVMVSGDRVLLWNGTCPAGSERRAEVSQCAACIPGKFSAVAGAACTPCTNNTYSNTTGATSCTACTFGYAFVNTTTACTPLVCNANEIITQSNTCGVCAAGSYRANSTACETCPVGHYCPSGSTTPTVCPATTYSNSTGVTSLSGCLACPSGSVAGAPASTSCDVCAAGTFADGQTKCTTCPAGSISSAGSLTCTNCTKGFFTNSTLPDVCAPCAPGSFSASNAATACTPCAAGTFASASQATACQQCALGSTTLQGESTCHPCATGTYGNVSAPGLCVLCPAGTFNNATNATSPSACVPCASGLASAAGASECGPCNAGYYASGDRICTICPAGFYSAKGASECTACPVGTFNGAPGAPSVESCKDCQPGTYAGQNASVCSQCAAGTYSPHVRANSSLTCTPCAEGSYSVNGQANCTLCPIGSYRATPGGAGPTSCTVCPTGTYSDILGRSVCSSCPAGTYNEVTGSWSASFCLNCAEGTYSNITGATTVTACHLCPVGTYSSSIGANNASACLACAAGKFSPAQGATSGAVCADCSAGRYSATPAQSSCALCVAGEYQDATGQSVCKQCTQGTISTQGGQSSCADCSAGEYQPNPGRTVCLKCPVGEYQSSKAASGCLPCAVGTYAASQGSRECTPCDPGTYANNITSASCDLCPKRTYQPATAQSSCFDCPVLSTTADFGSLNYSFCKCAVGYYGRNASCTACPATVTTCPRIGLEYPLAAAGYWFDTANPQLVLQCTPLVACPANNVASCAPGYQSYLCRECQQGYYRISGRCELCPDSTDPTFTLIIFLGAFVILAPILVRMAKYRQVFGIVTLAVTYVQVMSVFRLFSLPWPEELLVIFEYMSLFNLNIEIVHPECTIADWNWTYKWMIAVNIPLVFLLVLLVIYSLKVMRANFAYRVGPKIVQRWPWFAEHPEVGLPEGQVPSLRARLRYDLAQFLCEYDDEFHSKALGNLLSGFFLFITLGYTFICANCLEYFDCSLKEDGRWYLDADPSILCSPDDPLWGPLLPIGVVYGLVFVIGIPAWIYWHLSRNSHRLWNARFVRLYGALFLRFELGYYYWECLSMVRKMVLLGVQAFLTTRTLESSLISLIVLFLAVLGQAFARPFESTNYDRTETLLLLSNFVTLLSGLLFFSVQDNSSLHLFLTYFNVILIGICLAVVVVFVSLDVKTAVYMQRHADRMAKMQFISRDFLEEVSMWFEDAEADRREAILATSAQIMDYIEVASAAHVGKLHSTNLSDRQRAVCTDVDLEFLRNLDYIFKFVKDDAEVEFLTWFIKQLLYSPEKAKAAIQLFQILEHENVRRCGWVRTHICGERDPLEHQNSTSNLDKYLDDLAPGTPAADGKMRFWQSQGSLVSLKPTVGPEEQLRRDRETAMRSATRSSNEYDEPEDLDEVEVAHNNNKNNSSSDETDPSASAAAAAATILAVPAIGGINALSPSPSDVRSAADNKKQQGGSNGPQQPSEPTKDGMDDASNTDKKKKKQSDAKGAKKGARMSRSRTKPALDTGRRRSSKPRPGISPSRSKKTLASATSAKQLKRAQSDETSAKRRSSRIAPISKSSTSKSTRNLAGARSKKGGAKDTRYIGVSQSQTSVRAVPKDLHDLDSDEEDDELSTPHLHLGKRRQLSQRIRANSMEEEEAAADAAADAILRDLKGPKSIIDDDAPSTLMRRYSTREFVDDDIASASDISDDDDDDDAGEDDDGLPTSFK